MTGPVQKAISLEIPLPDPVNPGYFGQQWISPFHWHTLIRKHHCFVKCPGDAGMRCIKPLSLMLPHYSLCPPRPVI